MKKLLTYLSILTAAVLFTPNTAEARPHSHGTTTYVSGHSSCGCPIYTKKVFVNHDRYGRPVYRYYSVPSNCNCRVKAYRPSSHYSSHRSYHTNSHNRHYSRHTSSRHSSHGHHKSGTKFRVTYRR
ncbi:MAG: hypothetical protein ACSHX6_02825 [Akkermansiaceae bacterium]